MTSSPMISVVTPIHSSKHRIPQIRRALSTAKVPIQFIMVLDNPELQTKITPKTSNEHVVVSPRTGRGFAFLQGLKRIAGSITLFLHSDTIPPPNWDQAILTALQNPRVVGGGFSLSYDTPTPSYDLVIWAVNMVFRVSKEFYGDRAIFIRSDILRRCMHVLEVPLFEDVRLVKCMQNHGRVKLLKEKVITSTEAFRQQGFIRYLTKYLLCRSWYALGGSPFKIFNVYYSKKKK